jgi:hypothetical protein
VHEHFEINDNIYATNLWMLNAGVFEGVFLLMQKEASYFNSTKIFKIGIQEILVVPQR